MNFVTSFRLVVAVCLSLGASGAVFAQDDGSALPLRGVVTAVDSAVVSTELLARISALTVREGDGFAKGDLLISFDCTKYLALRSSAAAEHEIRKTKHSSNEALANRRAIAKHEVLIAAAEVHKARAKVDELDALLAQCELRAPYDGRVKQVQAHVFETPAANSPLMEIISDAELEIEIIVPSVWLKWLQPGVEFRVTLDETSTTYRASVLRSGANVDPVSQTVKIFGRFLETTPGVLDGMSGPVQFERSGS